MSRKKKLDKDGETCDQITPLALSSPLTGHRTKYAGTNPIPDPDTSAKAAACYAAEPELRKAITLTPNKALFQ